MWNLLVFPTVQAAADYLDSITFWDQDVTVWIDPPEKPVPETPQEEAAEQMAADILADKITPRGRQVVRGALDQKDAPLTGRPKEDRAVSDISRRGGV